VQLLVSCSDGSVGRIEIYDNTIDGAAYPLGLINHNHHPLRTTGAYVHHNRMTLRSSGDAVGAVAFDGLTELFSEAANNRFDSNTYRVTDPGARTGRGTDRCSRGTNGRRRGTTCTASSKRSRSPREAQLQPYGNDDVVDPGDEDIELGSRRLTNRCRP
jgi:hypothetical protein